MESIEIYEDSRTELLRVQKALGNASVTIDFNKLDSKSRGQIIKVLRDTISERNKEIESVILGVN